MYIDKYGLPVQQDGDANDQLQRVGMIAVACEVTNTLPINDPTLPYRYALTLNSYPSLQVSPGTFVRFTGDNPDNCSADQLVSALGASIILGMGSNVWNMFKTMMFRFGFAQNTTNGLGGNASASQIPDFMLLRAMPLIVRGSWWAWPLAWIFDIYLLVLVLGDYYYKQIDPDPADCNDTVLTLTVCRVVKPTFISLLCCQLTRLFGLNFSGRLTRYYRPETGANPEIAAMWQPICQEYFE